MAAIVVMYLEFLQLPHLSGDGPCALLILLLQCLKPQLPLLRVLTILVRLLSKLLPQLVQRRLPLGTQSVCILKALSTSGDSYLTLRVQ